MFQLFFQKYTAKQVIRPEDPLEKQNPIAHEYVLSASEYMRARGLKARKVADHKYVLPFKLDQPLIDLMPLFWIYYVDRWQRRWKIWA